MAHEPHRSILAALLIVAGTATTIVFAQDAPPSAPAPAETHTHAMHDHAMKHWQAMDTNHDGRISAAEYAAWAKAQFAEMDANHDGFVTQDEMHDHMKARMEAMKKERNAKMFERMDANHDGTISRDEFDAAMDKMHGMRGHMRGDHGTMGDGMHDDGMDGMQPPPSPPPPPGR